MIGLYCFSVGIFSVAWWPSLPSQPYCALFIAFSLLVYRVKKVRCLSWLLMGLTVGVLHGHWLVAKQLPNQFEKTDFVVTGHVVGLPQLGTNRVRFYFQIDEFLEPPKVKYFQQPTKVLLSWYYPTQSVFPEQAMTLNIRLRSLRGTVNPGGFDYQAWLLRKGVTAKGYVRDVIAVNEERLAPVSLDGFRFSISQFIQAMTLSGEAKALLVALTLGDKQYIRNDSWNNFAKSGVVHLLVISGLHIGFAAMVGYWIGNGLARCLSIMGPNTVARRWGLIAALMLACLYAALAGWSIPTQRASVMVGVVVLANLFSRTITKGTVFGASLALVAIIDPLAVLDGGFWLSFSAVAILLWAFPAQAAVAPSTINSVGVQKKLLTKFWLFFQIQLVISVGLVALLIIQGLPFSVVSPLTNLVAIPWVSLFVVPLCLMGVVSFGLSEQLAGWFWYLAGIQLDVFETLAANVSRIVLPVPDIVFPLSLTVYLAIFVALILLLLPLGRITKIPAIVLIVAILTTVNKQPPLKITVLDVGQGLAVVVQTSNHNLVYDTGPRFSEDINAGNAIVAPYLRYFGKNKIDALIVSHNDIDHSGGIAGLLERVDVDIIVADKQVTFTSDYSAREDCQHNKHWQWDDVKFTLINPLELLGEADEGKSKTRLFSSDNNQSCMLLIQYGDDTILFTGDIEKPIEKLLVQTSLELANISLLVAPHHGSKTSSSLAFVEYTSPQVVVFSAGFKHHFGHPHNRVVQRYKDIGSRLFNTATSGAISFIWRDQGSYSIEQHRLNKQRYWFANTRTLNEP